MNIKQSNIYAKWFEGLKDIEARARIDRRIKRAARGDYGDVKLIFFLLAGGTKKTQQEDIRLAKLIAAQI